MSQASPLPDGVVLLLRIAGGDQALAAAVAVEHSLDEDKLQEICAFFVQSVLFHPDSDHFRVLGATRDADVATLKLHYRWLQRWLHPDRDPDGWSSVYSHRVNMAWDVLKRPERRTAYLESLPPEAQGPGTSLAIGPVIIPMQPPRAPRWSAKWVTRLPALVSVFTVMLAFGVWWAHRAGQDMLAEQQRRASAPTSNSPAKPAEANREPAPTAAPASIAALQPAEPDNPEVLPAAASLESPEPAEVTILDAPVVPQLTVPTVSSLVESVPDSDSARVDAASTATPPDGPGRVVSVNLPGGRSPESATDARAAPASEALRDAAPVAMAAPMSAPVGAPERPVPASVTQADAPSVSLVSADPPRNRDPSSAPAAQQQPQESVAAPPEPPAAVPPASSVDRVAALSPPVEAERPAVSEPTEAVVAPVATVAVAPPVEAPPLVTPLVEAPVRSEVLVSAPRPEQLEQGVRLIRSFSNSYRNGAIQELVVMFKPNARTPVGNLLDFYSQHQSVFAQSATRSIEFLNVDWRKTDTGIEAAGRYEWAMRPRGGGRVRSTGGEFRIVIEFENGRALIARLEQRDVG